MKHIVSIIFIAFLISCGGDNNGDFNLDEVKASIEANHTKWKLSALSDYSYTYQRNLGDCPTADELPAMDITVEDNEVVSVFYAGTSEILDFDNAPTIDTIFGAMLDSLSAKPIKFRKSKNDSSLPSFDDSLGYPSMFYIDISSKDCDATLIRVTDFY
ncbi:hypothetical protein H4J38_07335 [Colwellia sp. BRX10-3]|uniref:DUF6174 domain-containing protein n=1 Tax=Colwellia sp. BRX10-3 TaxID=2759844 RepID=UPI0015F4D01F|nr:DUF6174 domain-containing protein [Colwellia sp. BRX10-3]MBA6390592.1 hypothetical protein [Colwellia sp. BRX10-3]